MSRGKVESGRRPLLLRLLVASMWHSRVLRAVSVRHFPQGRIRRTFITAVVERMYDSINQDQALPDGLLGEEFVLSFPSGTALFLDGTQQMRGPEAIRQMYSVLGQAFDRVEWEVDAVIEATGGRFACMTRMKGEGGVSQVPVDTPVALVASFRDGRIESAKMYMDRDEALEAAGLRE